MLENKETWENFNYKETMSELTPTGRWSILSKCKKKKIKKKKKLI